MTKTDQLVNALHKRFRNDTSDPSQADVLVLGYLTGLLGVLEGSDDKLAASLDHHLQDTLKYNATYKI
jgi:hypothetical protein